MDTKEVINKIKALLGIAEKPAEAPVETAPEEPKQPEALAEEAPKEEEKPTETAPENAEEKPAEEKPAEETPEVEKRVAELEGKVDELYGVVQALVEKITVEEHKDEPSPATAAPAQFAKQEEPKAMTRAERILALKNN